MLNISDELKQLYKNDFFPYTDAVTPKELVIYFPGLDITIRTDQIVDDSFSLDESLCSEEDIALGSCEATQIKFTVADITVDLTGHTFTIVQVIDGYDPVPLGTYKVDSCKKQADLRYKDIVAYDAIKETDIDVSDWYNSLSFPITKKSMLQSLLNHLGIDYEEQALPNDDELIEKTVSPSYLKGRDVLICLSAISGGFGHMSRLNKFKVILLSGLGLYPSESLYPSEDLFPSESGEFLSAGYMESNYEEYIVEPITGIRIAQDDEDIGTTVGTTENVYNIIGNFLLYGKNSEDLQRIAQNILLVIKNKYYRPHTTKMVGLPYIEVGDAVNIITTDDVIETFVFKRTLSGIQVLIDEISATGNKKIENNVGPNTEIQQLKGKTLKIEKNIDQLSIEMVDMGEGLLNQITITAGQLQTQITDNYNNLSSTITQTANSLQTQITDYQSDVNSQISQMADNISLKVSKGDVSSQLSMEHNQITITSNRLKIESDQFKLDGGTAWFGGTISWGSGDSISNDKNGNTYLEATELLWLKAPAIALGESNLIIINNTERSVDLSGKVRINNSTPITASNKSEYTFVPSTHYQDSTTINPRTTTAGNVGLNGLNVASVNWCNETFQKISSSDFRLKHDFKSLDEIPDELYLELKPWQYKFKVDSYGKGVFFGLLAQEVESAFARYGLNALDYNLIEISDKRDWTEEGQYVVDGKVHRINYENFHAWNIRMIQKIYKKVFEIV